MSQRSVNPLAAAALTAALPALAAALTAGCRCPCAKPPATTRPIQPQRSLYQRVTEPGIRQILDAALNRCAQDPAFSNATNPPWEPSPANKQQVRDSLYPRILARAGGPPAGAVGKPGIDAAQFDIFERNVGAAAQGVPGLSADDRAELLADVEACRGNL